MKADRSSVLIDSNNIVSRNIVSLRYVVIIVYKGYIGTYSIESMNVCMYVCRSRIDEFARDVGIGRAYPLKDYPESGIPLCDSSIQSWYEVLGYRREYLDTSCVPYNGECRKYRELSTYVLSLSLSFMVAV